MDNPESRYVELLTGGTNSPLLTDAYKFAMAQAGAPLRQETFYLSFRHGEPMYVPFDLAEVVRLLRPRLPNAKERAFLATHGFSMTPAMEAALQGDLDVWAAPRFAWVGKGEPILTVTGPSFLVSWLEPLLIALSFPLQVASQIENEVRNREPASTFDVTCKDEGDIVQLVQKCAGNSACTAKVVVRGIGDMKSLVGDLHAALGGDIHRAFEVGTRAMTCLQHHHHVLKALKVFGIEKTASLYLAYELYMIPVGTTGHEHQQRWLSDEAAFRAVRDCRPEPPSYLFDTYDAEHSGIPATQKVMGEDPGRRCSVRFDSGDQEAQLRQFMQGPYQPDLFIFMDGYDHDRTYEMERLCTKEGIPTEARIYGFGGYFMCAAEWQVYTRNRVAMVYKLTQTGATPVMKFAGSKSSVPGRPVILRAAGGGSLIAQAGEEIEGWGPLRPDQEVTYSQGYSEQTRTLITQCQRRAGIAEE
jgi:nicotinate phosphoribosyltransferase